MSEAGNWSHGLVDSLIGSIGVPLNVGSDLFDCQRTRSRVGRGHGDSGCADKFEAGVLCLEQVELCSATESPELEEDV